MRRRALWLISASLVATLLSGCGLPRMIDSDVNSFVGTARALAGASYRFERLPSQTDSQRQTQIEALAGPALAAVGLRFDAAQPLYAVQVGVNIEQIYAPQPYRPRTGIFATHDRFIGGGPSVFIAMEAPWYRYTVRVVMRDIASAQVAYETTAMHEGPWADAGNLLPLVLESALRDYPNPPLGLHRVVIELPAAGPGAR